MRDIISKLEELNVEKEQLNEGLGDMAHEAEMDHEVQMARSDLYKTAKYAVAIHKMMKDVSEMEGVDGWVAAKITKAADYLSAVKHHMEGEMMADVELAVVPVAGDMTDAMTMPQESLEEGRLGFKDIAKFGSEMASRIDQEARRRGSADMEPGDADELRYRIAKEMGLVEGVEVVEAEERTYIVVHAKHGKEEIKASSSYGAAKKYAEMKKLKSTAGVDAHLADGEKKTATESIEEADYNPELSMMANSDKKVERTYGAIMQGVRGRGPAEESEVGDYIPSGMTSAEIMQLIDMLEPQGYDKDFLMKDLAPMMKEDALEELTQAQQDRINAAPGRTIDDMKPAERASLKKFVKNTPQNTSKPAQDFYKKMGYNKLAKEDTDVIGDIIGKLAQGKAGQRGGKDVIGDIIAKLPKDDKSVAPQADKAATSKPEMPKNEPNVSAQQKQKMVNKAVTAPKTLPKAPPQRPKRIRSFAQDTTAPLSMMQNWSKK